MATRIKICGITNVNDAELAASLGVDMIGINFYRQSPRFVDDATAGAIVRAIPLSIETVGVFVSKTWADAFAATAALEIGAVQMHGDFDGQLMPKYQSIPAFAVQDASSLNSIFTYLASSSVAPRAILVDGHMAGQFGGTGQAAPWQLLADFHPGVPLILAGGLTPENVAEAIRIVKPFAVDVASGVESSPGKKDADKMRRFIDAVRSLPSA